MRVEKINKSHTVVAEKYIWLSIKDDQMPADIKCANIEGVLQIDEWDNNFIDFIRLNNIKGIEIKGDKFENTSFGLAFLEELSDLKYLKISGKFKKSEYKVINKMTSLEELILSDYEAYDVNFSQFKFLKAYFSPIKHINHPIFSCKTLSYLGTKTTLEDTQPFTNLKNLKHLYLFARKLKSLQGLDKLDQLQVLSIDYASYLKDISSLSNCKNISILSLYSCKSIYSLEHIANIEKLKYLSFDNCGTIKSLTPLEKCNGLEFLSFGDTLIEDGNIAVLKKINSLKRVYFRNKKHYNSTIEDFK